MYEAAVTGDLRQVSVLQQRILRLSSKIYSVGISPSGYLTGLKAALSILGLCDAGCPSRSRRYLLIGSRSSNGTCVISGWSVRKSESAPASD